MITGWVKACVGHERGGDKGKNERWCISLVRNDKLTYFWALLLASLPDQFMKLTGRPRAGGADKD